MVERGIAGPKVTGSIPVNSFFYYHHPHLISSIYTSFFLYDSKDRHDEFINIPILVLVLDYNRVIAWVLELVPIAALPFSDCCNSLSLDVDVETRRLLNFSLIEGESPEDSKMIEKININERIIVLLLKMKIAFP